MKHKILPGFLALAVVSAMGMAPARVQAASLEDVKQNLQGKGIIVAGNISNLDELKQKLESMGIDCSIPGWLESLTPRMTTSRKIRTSRTTTSRRTPTLRTAVSRKIQTPRTITSREIPVFRTMTQRTLILSSR